MKKLLTFLLAASFSVSALAGHHDSTETEVRDAVEAFNTAYATNDVETYFGFYAEDATAFWYGERQVIATYYEEWTAMIDAGGGVEKNDISDLQVQIMPSGDVAVSTTFVDNRTRSPEGEVTEAKAFETDVWQKIDGEWKIVSLHFSEIAPE